jgi:hypothetical protein
MNLEKCVKNFVLGTTLMAISLTQTGCPGSCSNMMNDISRDISKKDYEITLYANDGKVIMHEVLPNTFVQLSENGSGVRYLKNGKSVILNGTYILKEK